MTVPHVSEGERITAGWANNLADAANAVFNTTFTGGRVQVTSNGIALTPDSTLTVALFQLVDDWTYPDSGTDDPTPFSENAKRLILTRSSPVVDESNIYQHTVGSQVLFDTQTIYAPTCYRDGSEIGFGPRPAGPNQRVWCAFSNETSRWELFSPALILWSWAVLDEELTEGSSATASLWLWDGDALADSGDSVEAHDWLLGSGETIAADTRIKVEFMPDTERWWVTAARCS